MREVKFRAWVKDEEKMYQNIGILGELVVLEYKPTGELMYWGTPNDGDAVMQYTGLKDKNGKEIYEGDIVSMFQGSQKSEVLFGGGMFSVKRSYRTSFYHDELELRHEILFNVIDTSEVIGNIYENPELLEGN